MLSIPPVNMSFYRITNPKKRDALIEDLIATKKRLKNRSMQERLGDMYHQRDLEEQYHPVLQSNADMVEKIKKDLKPIKEEVEDITRYIKQEPEEEELPRKKPKIDLADIWRNKVLAQDPDVDTSFGIRFEQDGTAMMGNQQVKLNGNNIIVSGVEFNGTRGLWDLLASKKPFPLSHYTKEERRDYADLLRLTSVMHRDFDPDNPHPRANRTWKWKHILNKLWFAFRNEPVPIEDEPLPSDDSWDEEDEEKEQDVATGTGLHFEAYVQRDGKCYHVRADRDGGVLFKPCGRKISSGDGIFLKKGQNIYNGEGLLLGPNSPYISNTILGWLL